MGKTKQLPVLITEEDISRRTAEIADNINARYGSEPITVICVLTGAILFTADLVRKLKMPVYIDTMKISSYGDSTESSGVVTIVRRPSENLKGKNVLIVEDIVDTGLTINTIAENIEKQNPSSIAVATLLHKPSRTVKPFNLDFVGFEIEDKFVIGYGMDYAGRYRNLPYISYLEK